MAKEIRYDLIILGAMLSSAAGFTVVKGLRERAIKTAIIFLTEKNSSEDYGEHYLSKPFSFGELLAGVRGTLQHDKQKHASVLSVDDLSVDLISGEVKRGDVEISLTSKEYELLKYLLRNKGRVLARAIVLEHIWGMNYGVDVELVDACIRNLRSKVEFDGASKLIHTIHGVGYLLKY